MISCTEFIPLYSEFFKYLDRRGGYDEVLKYWYHISDTSIGDKTNPHSMAYHCERLGGFEGARAYWGHTTSEEACDVYAVLDLENKYSYSEMNYCPSRAMLNSFEHITPYENYCEHCKIIYSRVLEKYGCIYERDHSRVHEAKCSSVLYEAGNPPPADYKEPKEGRKVSHMKREGKKYLHRDFHLLGDNALKYCGDQYGADAVVGFMRDFALTYFAPIIDDAKARGLVALKEWLEKIYEVEECPELLHTELTENSLTVTVDKSPVIEYMHSLNQKPSEYYIEETRTLYAAIAEGCGFGFELEYYNEDGGTRYRFTK